MASASLEGLKIRGEIDLLAGQTYFLPDIIPMDLYGPEGNINQFRDLLAAKTSLDHIAALDLAGSQSPFAIGDAHPEPGRQLQCAFLQKINMLVIQRTSLTPEFS